MTTERMLRFGLIGVDSSHAMQFTRLLDDGRVAGGRVVAAWAGPTASDFPPGQRATAHAAELPTFGVDLLDTPEAVAEASDALLLVSSDARTRLEQFRRIAPAGIPVYVDTRFSASPSETDAMLQLAAHTGTLVLSGSPKRFTPEFRAALSASAEHINLTGPLVEQPGHAGLAWYGVHLIDLAVAALGPGCRRIEPRDSGLLLTWGDGRTATINGPAEWEPWTSGSIRTPSGARDFAIEANEDMLRGLLTGVVDACRADIPNITPAEIREISTLVAAGSTALASGRAVALS